MRLYGALSELTSLVIRLASGKTVKIQANEQTAAGETQITIPDVVDGADTVVLADTQQTLTQKTLTAPTLTSAAINSTTKVVIPSQSSPTHNAVGSLIWDGAQGLLTVGNSNLGGYKTMVDLDSSQTLFQKTISGGSLSGGAVVGGAVGVVGAPTSINNISKLAMGDIGASVGANHVVITNANKEAITEATLSKSRGGAGADMTNVVFPATGTLVTEAGSQTLSNKTIGTVTAESGTLTVSGTGALRLPLGTEANRPAGTAATLKGMIRYNDEADAFEGYNELSGWSSLGGGGTTDRVTQASHGFVVGEVLYLNGSTYAKAVASAANTAEVVGVVSRIIDASTFELTLSGEISGLSGLTPGEVYFLDASTPGAITIVEPSVVGQVSLPVGVASSASTLYVAPKRGVVVGAANARTTISVSNNAATNVVSVTNYNSLKLEGELNVTRSSGGNQRAYYTVEAAKNGAGVWQVSASYTGDDVLYTTLPSWDVASNNLQVTMPLVTNFSSASLTYSLNAPAVGASLPLAIDSTALNVVDSAPLSYRNRIINGDMRIDQRNSGASVTPTTAGTYTLDRWNVGLTQASKFSVVQSAVAPSGFTSSLLVTSTSAYSVGASDTFFINQSIEGFNTADLMFGTASAATITLSFWVRSSLTGTFGGAVGNAGMDYRYPFTFTIGSANTWERKTITISGATAGTWVGATNGRGLRIVFNLGSGATYSGTANAWGSGEGYAPTGAQSVVGTNGATFYLTGVQLEVGSKASAFERRPYGMELQLCQRYCFVPQIGGGATRFGWGYAVSGVTVTGVIKPPVTMRISPNISISSVNFLVASDGTAGTALTGLITDSATNSADNAAFSATVASGLTTFRGYWLEKSGAGTPAAIIISAEL